VNTMNKKQLVIDVDGESIQPVIQMIKEMDFSKAEFLKLSVTFDEPKEDTKAYNKVVEKKMNPEDDMEWEYVQTSKTPEVEASSSHHKVLKTLGKFPNSKWNEESVWKDREWDVQKDTVRAAFSRLYHRGCIMRSGPEGERVYKITSAGQGALQNANFKENQQKEDKMVGDVVKNSKS